jgi:hypothetical protein
MANIVLRSGVVLTMVSFLVCMVWLPKALFGALWLAAGGMITTTSLGSSQCAIKNENS